MFSSRKMMSQKALFRTADMYVKVFKEDRSSKKLVYEITLLRMVRFLPFQKSAKTNPSFQIFEV